MQESRSRAVTLALVLRDLIKAKPFLRCAVEIRIALKPRFFAGCDECLRQRIDGAKIAYAQRPRSAVIFRCATLLFFRFFEVGQYVRVGPARITQIPPLIIISAVAANVDHGIHGTAAAKNFAARPIQAAIT